MAFNFSRRLRFALRLDRTSAAERIMSLVQIQNNVSRLNSSETHIDDIHMSSAKILEAILLFSLVFFAVAGNGLLIYVIYLNHNLHSLRNAFVASLAVADLMLACTDIVYQALEKVVINFQPPHPSICYIILLSGVLFGSASVFNLTAMTLVRYISIRHPLHFNRYVTAHRSAAIVLVVWLTAFCLAFPPLIWRPESVVCSTTKPSDEHIINEAIYMSAEWLFWFFIPLMLISFSYYRIYLIARGQARQIAALEVSTDFEGPTTKTRGRASSLREKKAGRMVAILIGFWILCWMPFFTVLTISKFKSRVPSSVMRLFLCLMFANSAINPIVLTRYNRELKVAIKKLLCGRKHRSSVSVMETRSNRGASESFTQTTF
ncbi:alpha-2A adrenergic receptor-like [Orbicella faveolata]|uniref:alpha-2A adrenergic receptor-like n=1 Tax=Orbicella faveolata TaxID=48498 RepID=UPI0009E5BB61|nr:alpha-2A adrenergic receptor-like [Orbicella faveolata]